MDTRPPLRLMVGVQGPNGLFNRWGPDEPRPADVPGGLTFSSTMPGGFEQMTCTLTREPGTDYPDLAEFSTVTVYGAGGEIAWQGRLETTPRASGDQLSITPGVTGYQAALADNNMAREIYIDCDLTRWQGSSVQRQISQSASFGLTPASVTPDATTGQPSLAETISGAWSTPAMSEAFYDANTIPLAVLYYAWKRGVNTSNTDPSWLWVAYLSDDDINTAYDNSGNLRAAGPGTGSLAATTTTRDCAFAQVYYNAPGGTSGTDYSLYWTYLGVVGRHGLPIRGTLGATGGIGVYASDVVAHAVGKYAPGLAMVDSGGNSTIEQTSFIIPQLAFTDATTAAAIVTQATSYGLEDWWVDEGPTFHLASRANHGRDWQARVGPSGLQETGPQVDQIYNGAVVTYTDVSGIARTVGPPGSGANTEDARLYDSDPANPATAAGLKRYSPPIQLGVSVAAAAVKVGQAFLTYQKQQSTAGQASLAGYVTDTTGVTWPAWVVRAGDRITFVDAHDPVPRRIVRSSYDDTTRTCQIDLDTPPEGLQPTLARIMADQVQGLA